MTNEQLIELAKSARNNAQASISKFKVGAALLTTEGKVFTGCNIEDPSGIGLTNVCAERCAVIKAISEGYTKFEKIAVVGGIENLVDAAPCGICRQYLNSFGPNMQVIFMDNNEIVTKTVKELLPHSFNEQF